MWLCKLIGHKFVKTKGGYVYSGPMCWRCGEHVDTRLSE